MPAVPRAAFALLLCSCLSVPGEVQLSGVRPAQVGAVFGTRLSISGTFEPRVALDFNQPDASAFTGTFTAALTGPRRVPLTAVARLSSSLLQANVPPAAPPGRYTLEVIGPTGTAAQLLDAVEVLDCSGACVPGCGGCADAGP